MLQTLPKIKSEYIDTGKVRYVFKDFPLAFHANAQMAAEASRCAGAQDAYWPMHDLLFENQSEWSGLGPKEALEAFVGYARGLELDVAAFETCLESRQFAAQIARDAQEGQRAGVRGTPSFLINDQLLAGAYPFEDFQQVIEAELGEAR